MSKRMYINSIIKLAGLLFQFVVFFIFHDVKHYKKNEFVEQKKLFNVFIYCISKSIYSHVNNAGIYKYSSYEPFSYI